MSGRKSKNKGAGFERQVAKMFSEAYGLEFRRTPLSGGWAKDSDVAAGDLVCVDDPDFPYCIECKKSEGWKLESLFTDNHAWFDNWWKQVVDECPEDKEPILVFSRNRMPIFVAVRTDMFLRHTVCDEQNGKLYLPVYHPFIGSHIFLKYTESIMVILLSDFLEWDTELVDS